MVALNASTHRVLVQHHGVSKSVHPGVSNINITTSTPKGVTAAPFFLTVYTINITEMITSDLMMIASLQGVSVRVALK